MKLWAGFKVPPVACLPKRKYRQEFRCGLTKAEDPLTNIRLTQKYTNYYFQNKCFLCEQYVANFS